jgi:nucleoside-diphosphate-sugar epimerase
VIRKALLTGATGYIGHNLANRLLNDGVAVAAVVRLGSDVKRLRRLSGSLEVCVHDGTTAGLVRIVADVAPDVAFHLAAVGKAAHTADDVEPLIRSNVLFGTQLLEALCAAGVRTLVNAGTFWQHYGGDDAYEPSCLYAATKQAFEDVLTYYVGAAGLHAVTLKLFDVYGPHDRRRKLFKLLTEAQQSGEPLRMSPGEQELDLVYIDDIVEAFLAVALQLRQDPGLSGRAFAISSGRRLPLRQVVALFEDVSGRPVPVEWGGIPYRPREVMVPWRGDLLPGWGATVPLEEGIRRVLVAGSGDENRLPGGENGATVEAEQDEP